MTKLSYLCAFQFLALEMNDSIIQFHVINVKKNTLPIKGTESDVAGMISATKSINTVRESRTVIPATKH